MHVISPQGQLHIICGPTPIRCKVRREKREENISNPIESSTYVREQENPKRATRTNKAGAASKRRWKKKGNADTTPRSLTPVCRDSSKKQHYRGASNNHHNSTTTQSYQIRIHTTHTRGEEGGGDVHLSARAAHLDLASSLLLAAERGKRRADRSVLPGGDFGKVLGQCSALGQVRSCLLRSGPSQCRVWWVWKLLAAVVKLAVVPCTRCIDVLRAAHQA